MPHAGKSGDLCLWFAFRDDFWLSRTICSRCFGTAGRHQTDDQIATVTNDNGAGWQRDVSISPDGSTYLLTTQNVGNARGATGWDVWQAGFATLQGTREIFLPDGTYPGLGSPFGETLHRAQRSAWSPDGTTVAVVLPPQWDPGIAPNEDYGHVGEAGELWLWKVGATPTSKITAPVDDGSPVQWLP